MTDCENDKDDATAVLGKPDGIADYGTFSGYYSLNGRTIIVAFSGEEILCGDSVYVFEMYNADAPFASVENYKVSVGQGEDGPWAIESDWVTGGNSVEVTWDW